MDNLETFAPLAVGALIGALVGAAAQVSQFCSRRALADSFSGTGHVYLRSFGVAVLVAIAATQTLLLATDLDLSEVMALRNQLPLTGLTVGGLLFGAGMMLAGGCPHRLLVRTGQGQLSALALLMILVVTVMATRDGMLSPLRLWISESTVTLNNPSLDTLLALKGSWLVPAGALIAALILAAKSLRTPASTGKGLVVASIVIGLCCAASWYFSVALADPFDLPTPHPLSYIAPTQELVRFFAMSELGFALKFGTTLVIGTVAGSAISTTLFGRTHSRPAALALTGRTVTGAALMGFGGVLAQGCTFGQGLAGLSVLSLASVWVVLCMSAGAWFSHRWLIAGTHVPMQVDAALSATSR